MRILATALMLLLGLVTFAGMWELRLASDWLVALLLCLGLQLIVIFFHELGHALAAKRRGATLAVLAVLWWEYDFRTRKLCSAREIEGGDVGGFVIYSFDDEREPTRRDDAIIAAAGPVANMLLALLAFVTAFSLSVVQSTHPGPTVTVVEETVESNEAFPVSRLPSEELMAASMARYDEQRRRETVTRWLEGIASIMAVLSLGMGLTNLIPFRGSDGDRLWWALSRNRTWHPSDGG